MNESQVFLPSNQLIIIKLDGDSALRVTRILSRTFNAPSKLHAMRQRNKLRHTATVVSDECDFST